METCGSAARNVCSAAGKLMFIRRRKKICGPVEKKVAAVGKFVRLREHSSAAGKRSRLWEGLFSCGSICSAAGSVYSEKKGNVTQGTKETFFVQRARSDRSPGTSLQFYFLKGNNNQRDQMQKEKNQELYATVEKKTYLYTVVQ